MGDERGIQDRLYTRNGRYYADFRDYPSGGRRALIPEDSSSATTDADVAFRLAEQRRGVLRRQEEGGPGSEDPFLKEFSESVLEQKRATGRRESTLKAFARRLKSFFRYFGEGVRMDDLSVQNLYNWLSWRREQPGRSNGETVSQTTLHRELTVLSGLYKRAMSHGLVDENPVDQMHDKPQPETQERTWLEPEEATRLLSEARKMSVGEDSMARPYFYPLVATVLLTGGRRSEVFGLLWRDVEFSEDTEHESPQGWVHFRANRFRELKKDRHDRTVPLWPQLREILQEYREVKGVVEGVDEADLVFPSPVTGAMLDNCYRAWNTLVERCSFGRRVTLHNLRHTYCASRLQTMDEGQPVSPYTVMRELGHKGLQQILDTYGHLLQTRNRDPVVEFREADVIDIGEARVG